MKGFFSKYLIGLAALTAAAVLAQPATAVTRTGQSGNVRAEISYDKPEEYQYKNIRLKIVRSGQTVLERQISQESDYDRPVVDFDEKSSLPVVDLDGDKEPEVIVDIYTGGAHCCTYSLIYRYDSKAKSYLPMRQNWGNVGYQLKDLNQDRVPEFNSADDRFAYAFSSYAGSGLPIQIWQYRQGKMIDVTRRYPKLIYSHASQLWQSYTDARKQGDDGKGFLAPYLADKYLLGQGEDGWKRVRQAYRGRDRTKYFADLRRFLRETGYTR